MGRKRDFIDRRHHCIQALRGPQVLLEPAMDTFAIAYDDDRHEYKIDGDDVPSVTQVLDKTLHKPALVWWGYRVGMAAIPRLMADGKLSAGQVMAYDWEPIVKPELWREHEQIEINDKTGKARSELEGKALAGSHSPNHLREEKGTLGTSIHVAAEQAGAGNMPTIEDFPEADRGYVQGLARYLINSEVEATAQEVIVGSKSLGFAGRFDVIAQLPSGKRRLRDYKTSGGVYGDFDVQLSGYWIGYHEMGLHLRPDEGFGPLDGADIVWLGSDGSYEVVPVSIDPSDFVCELLAFHQRRDRDARIRALGRKP